MTDAGFAKLKWQTKIVWCLMLAAGIIAAVFAVIDLFSFSVSEILILGLAIPTAFIVTQHKITVPGTKIRISARETIVFFSILWLGVSGGVLPMAGSLLYKFKGSTENKAKLIYQICAAAVATFAAGNGFYFGLYRAVDFSNKTVADHSLNAVYLLFALVVLAIFQYSLNSTFNLIFIRLEQGADAEDWQRNFAMTAPIYGLSAISAFGIHLLFVFFGLAFGWVLVPLAFAAHFAYRIHERRLEQKISEIGEASRVHLATVEALATAIDARDQVGVGHVRRTQIYAIGIGKNLDLPEDEIDALRTGALLHDIGKLAVPDHILNKPGRLTSAEMEKVKIHSSVGASILEKVGFSYPVVPTVKYHHEAWDGSGYPDGLAGEAIPLTARILAVADAYDTLRGARPYRGAILRDDARRFLLNGAGTQYDPKVIDIFLRNLRTLEAEVEVHGLAYVEDDKEKATKSNHVPESGVAQSYVEQIKRANHEVFTLYELAKVFSSSLNLNETFSLFAKKIGEFIPFDTCAVYLMDEIEESAAVVYVEGKNSAALKNKSIKVGEGATGYVLKKRLPVQKINPGLDFSFSQLEFVQEYTSMVSLPLIADDKLIGAVSLYSCDLEAYEEEHLRILETVSRIASDAISKALQHAETETRAMTDPMTGLPNARSLQIQFEKEMARADRSQSSFQVLMLDLDGFKAVNDTFGHKVGDRLLKEISKVMRGQLRDYDFLSRYAGDEFVAIIPETDAETVRELCERLENAVMEFRLPVSESVFARVGVSLGAAGYPQAGSNFDQMVVAADKAMYNVKSIRKQEQKKQQLKQQALPVMMHAIPMQPFKEEDFNRKSAEQIVITEVKEDGFIVEVDESHIISAAIN